MSGWRAGRDGASDGASTDGDLRGRVLTRYRALSAVGVASLSVGVGFTLMLAVGAHAASVAPGVAWKLDSLARPTSFSASDDAACASEIESCDHYTLLLTNVGAQASDGTITITDELPANVTTAGTPEGEGWSCTPGAGMSEVGCTTNGSVPAMTPAAGAIVIPVEVSGGAVGTPSNEARVAGGVAGCDQPGQPPCPFSSSTTPTPIGAPALPFGILEGTLSVSSLDASGLPDSEAGAHPDAVSAAFAFPSAIAAGPQTVGPFPAQDVKQIVIDLPSGVAVDASSAPTCSLSELTDISEAEQSPCADARVGTLALFGLRGASTGLSIFNVTPEKGYAAEFGVYEPVQQRTMMLYGTLAGSGAASHLRLVSAPQDSAIVDDGLSLTFFGDPAIADGSALEPAAVFTNPSDCGASGFTSTIHVDSWQQPARVLPSGEPDLSDPNWKGAESSMPPVTGCETLQFRPEVEVKPETTQADSPSGYEIDVKVPQSEAPDVQATPPLRSAVVTLPAGVAIAPAGGAGLQGCEEAGVEAIGLESPEAGHCPAAATVGTAEVLSPILRERLQGAIYIARPACGGDAQSMCTEAAAETGAMLELYVEVGSEASGVHLKFKGDVEVGGAGPHSREVGLQPGQLRVSFADLPQQPLSELKLAFHGGPRALLGNPQSCGTVTATSELEPWSHQPAPGEAHGTPDATLEPSFAIAGCEGGFSPSFSAGTVDPQADAATPFTLTVSRHDREQGLGRLDITLPPGLLGDVAGVSPCGESEANAGTCPAAARIGTATIASGSGLDPLWQSGSIYLTGPYGGGQFGVAVVVPADVGPFDLGTIVVRGAIRIDPDTAQLTLATDLFPQALDGVPLRVRTVNLTIDRPGFIVNPTNCEPMAVHGTVTSLLGTVAPVVDRFQVANCATLPFTPRLKALTLASGAFTGHGASLRLALSTTAGQAGIRSLKVDLPQRLPARLGTIQHACKHATFAANPAACPSASVIGSATVQTPILASALIGPVYLVSYGGSEFPDMVLVLQAGNVRIDLTGALYVNAQNITSTTFRAIPDVPIRHFEIRLPEGKRSVLAASAPLCGRSLQMLYAIAAQDGARTKGSIRVAVSGCEPTRAQKRANAPKACRRRRAGTRRMCEMRARRVKFQVP